MTRAAALLALSLATPAAACPGSDPAAAIAWARLRNPIVSFPERAIKDVTVRLVDGRWRMLGSLVSRSPFRFRVALLESEDWTDWQLVGEPWDLPEAGGLASPDLIRRRDGTFVVAMNSHRGDWPGEPFARSRPPPALYYRTSRDFRTWSPLRPLLGGHRLIDAALAETPAGLVLAFKRGQTFRIAVSRSGALDGPWRDVGAPDTRGLENYQLLRIDGRWHLLATTLDDHQPALYALAGDPAAPEGWLRWAPVRILDVPHEDWNRGRSDAAYLCDARPLDGHFYLFYAGARERLRFRLRGHTAIGVARSRDLVSWERPPAATTP